MTGSGLGVTLVHLLVSAQVGYHREVAPTAVDVASEWLLAGMAVHVRLQGAWSGEALVADLAFVFLLRVFFSVCFF